MLLTENYLAFDPSQSDDNLYKVGSCNFWDNSRNYSATGTSKTYLDIYDKDWFNENGIDRLIEYEKVGKRIPIVIKKINKIEIDPSLDPQPSAEQIAEWENEKNSLGIAYLDFYYNDNIEKGISCSNSDAETTFFSSFDANLKSSFSCPEFSFPFDPPSTSDPDSGLAQ